MRKSLGDHLLGAATYGTVEKDATPAIREGNEESKREEFFGEPGVDGRTAC